MDTDVADKLSKSGEAIDGAVRALREIRTLTSPGAGDAVVVVSGVANVADAALRRFVAAGLIDGLDE